jgi:hypothetical protein
MPAFGYQPVTLIAILMFEEFIDEWSVIGVTVGIIDEAPKNRYNR